jgi:hypothetical protein
LRFDTNDGIAVSIRLAKLDDAPSLQKNCLPGNTPREVEDFLKNDTDAMNKGDKVRLVADVRGEVVARAQARCLEIVKICVEGKNIPAIGLYAKTGFKEYGRLERGIIRKGEYDDLILLKKDL